MSSEICYENSWCLETDENSSIIEQDYKSKSKSKKQKYISSSSDDTSILDNKSSSDDVDVTSSSEVKPKKKSKTKNSKKKDLSSSNDYIPPKKNKKVSESKPTQKPKVPEVAEAKHNPMKPLTTDEASNFMRSYLLKNIDNEKITIEDFINTYYFSCLKQVTCKDGKNYLKLILSCKELTDTEYADIFHIVYNGSVLYDSISNVWFIINKNNIWKNNPLKINNIISHQFYTFILRYIKQQIKEQHKLIKENDKYENIGKKRVKRTDLIKQYQKSITQKNNRLGNTLSISKIVKAISNLKYKRKYIDNMDIISEYLFPFKNGVYDLINNVFRNPEPLELVNHTCGYNYRKKDKAILKAYKHLNEIFSEMFLCDEDRDTILNEFAQCLDSTVKKNSHVFIHYSSGSSGKSMLSKFIMAVLGKHFSCVIPSRYFSEEAANKRDPNSPDGLLNSTYLARIVFAPEIGKGDLDMECLKALTGQDMINCRAIYKTNVTFYAKFKLFLQTNHQPKIKNAASEAIQRRIQFRPFAYTYVDKSRENNLGKYERVKNEELMSLLDNNDDYKLAFFNILKKYYIKQKKEAFVISDNFKNATIDFLANNDPGTSFFNRYIIVHNDFSEKTNLTALTCADSKKTAENNRKYIGMAKFFEYFCRYNKKGSYTSRKDFHNCVTNYLEKTQLPKKFHIPVKANNQFHYCGISFNKILFEEEYPTPINLQDDLD